MRQGNQGRSQKQQRRRAGFRAAQGLGLVGLLALASATSAPARAQPAADTGWQACSATTDRDARLACFDAWAAAARQAGTPPAPPPVAEAQSPPALASNQPATAASNRLVLTITPPAQGDDGCHDVTQPSGLRQFDLRPDTSCPRLTLRGWRPTSLALVGSTSVNTAPDSPSPGHAAPYTPYMRNETRIQVSVRTKILSNVMTAGQPERTDSLWFGYTSQSYWQLFNGAISRPFRNTDHEPELYYVFPLDTSTAPGWRLRYGGLGVVHQSNGQSLPLSRSWNRTYVMGGLENTVPAARGTRTRLSLAARIWNRWGENAASDDNPDIANFVGRGEFSARWYPDAQQQNILGLTLRHSLRGQARGSYRLEWLNRLDSAPQSGMYSHVSLFSGYGDSLLDYNRRRTVLTLGLSLLDW